MHNSLKSLHKGEGLPEAFAKERPEHLRVADRTLEPDPGQGDGARPVEAHRHDPAGGADLHVLHRDRPALRVEGVHDLVERQAVEVRGRLPFSCDFCNRIPVTGSVAVIRLTRKAMILPASPPMAPTCMS